MLWCVVLIHVGSHFAEWKRKRGEEEKRRREGQEEKGKIEGQKRRE